MRVLLALLQILLLIDIVFGDDDDIDYWFGIGQGREDISVEVGYRNGSIGANVYVAGDYDYSFGEVEANEPPHNNYIRENDKKVGQAFGFDLMYISPYLLYVEGGIAIQEYRDLAISTGILDTGVIYTLDRSRKISIGYGIGLMGHYKRALFGLEVHNKKGIIANIGWRF